MSNVPNKFDSFRLEITATDEYNTKELDKIVGKKFPNSIRIGYSEGNHHMLIAYIPSEVYMDGIESEFPGIIKSERMTTNSLSEVMNEIRLKIY
jgi:hypothetical protein